MNLKLSVLIAYIGLLKHFIFSKSGLTFRIIEYFRFSRFFKFRILLQMQIILERTRKDRIILLVEEDYRKQELLSFQRSNLHLSYSIFPMRHFYFLISGENVNSHFTHQVYLLIKKRVLIKKIWKYHKKHTKQHY